MTVWPFKRRSPGTAIATACWIWLECTDSKGAQPGRLFWLLFGRAKSDKEFVRSELVDFTSMLPNLYSFLLLDLFIFFLYEKKTNQKKRTPAALNPFKALKLGVALTGVLPCNAQMAFHGHLPPTFSTLNGRYARGPKGGTL
ncbi:hypothetical protein L1F30_03720 [Simiduia sp. 21SJ11W-1]|uniref:hypothetical protein n=1 Tax=Simiduia sp. 21SJ11W-1 TaxID=2909669 RepID=UPI00209FF1F6|nr:hypothetical protein [Simiduia sp. 21SJ11W-1]UTA48657.1 hypothetical protein L1F30_03720 [Simiduia sp. 21SJ11W-1]